ncbi:hypothetical protein KBD61_06220 [Patescibacteria group bacterium]|nr:hypothetical protein [Candidatus Paceibacterota bacterium]MBP9710582.1 hypothetical protein [Patescibacteria group bacterium]
MSLSHRNIKQLMIAQVIFILLSFLPIFFVPPSSFIASIYNILFGLFGMLSVILAIFSFYYGWKLRKLEKKDWHFIASILILLLIGVLEKLLPPSHLFALPTIALIGLHAKRRLMDKQLVIQQPTP